MVRRDNGGGTCANSKGSDDEDLVQIHFTVEHEYKDASEQPFRFANLSHVSMMAFQYRYDRFSLALCAISVVV